MNDDERRILDDYLANRFVRQKDVKDDDEFIVEWQAWLMSCDAPEILNGRLCSKRPVKFAHPEGITIELHDSLAGKVPLIIFEDASDFEDFITNLIYRGERPENLSQMGASFIYGKRQRFLVLSRKYYSNTPPEQLGLSAEEWREKSLVLRREHECTHYYTKRYYGSASNNLHDELIADFTGMYEAFGRYDAKLFCSFMGIDHPHDGRLGLYTSGLSREAREVIAGTARQCSESLEAWSRSESFIAMDKASRINYLCEAGIDGINKAQVPANRI